MEAYVLVNCDAGLSWKIVEIALRMKNVKMAHAVTGQFDAIAYIEFSNMDALTDILGEFQKIEGIRKTHTAVAIPPRLE